MSPFIVQQLNQSIKFNKITKMPADFYHNLSDEPWFSRIGEPEGDRKFRRICIGRIFPGQLTDWVVREIIMF
jgi:hypothetical protein